jgi:hypothetical protein
MEKKADVAARLARNSPAIGAKKAPKLYMVPKTTNPTVNAASTMTQARRESGRLTSDGECLIDTFTTFLAGGRKGQNTKHVEAATLRFVLSLGLLLFENRSAGVCHQPWRPQEVIPCEVELFLSNAPRGPGGTVMSHEHDDPAVTHDAIEAAVTLTVGLRSRRQSASIEELATEAVDSTFRTCATGAAGTNAPERPAHAALIADVGRRAHTRIAMAAPDNPVDVASGQSFPASDPPAWIWR